MRSFTLSAFASLAFGIFCSAAPTPSSLPTVNLPPVAVAARDTTVPTVDTQTLQSVLTVATNAVNPLADQVANLHTVSGIEDTLSPILEQLVDILECAVTGLQGLANIPIKDRLLDITTDVQLDVQGIVQLIAPLLRTVVTILINVVSLVDGTVRGNVLSLVAQITTLLAQLLTLVLSLVGDMVTEVVTGVLDLIEDLIPFIITNLGELLQVLGISM